MLALCLWVLPPSAYAAELPLDTTELVEELPGEARELIGDLRPDKLPDDSLPERLWGAFRDQITSHLSGALHTAGILLLVCVFVALSETLELGKASPPFIIYAGVAAIGASAISDLDSYLQMGMESLRELSEYSRVLLPVLSTASAAAGGVSAAAGKYAATAMMMDALLSAANAVVAPGICAFAALSLANAALGSELLAMAKKLVKTVCTSVLSALCMGFTAWLTLTGVLSGVSDTLTARMAKTAISGALPVVGGILADAAGSLSAAAAVMRNSIGIFGLLAVAGICLESVCSLAVRYMMYRISAAVCTCVANKRLGELIRDLGTCFGLILSLNGAGAMMLFVSVYSLMRTVVG